MSRWTDWIVVGCLCFVAAAAALWHDSLIGVALAVAYSAGRWDAVFGWKYAERRTRKRDAERRAREQL